MRKVFSKRKLVLLGFILVISLYLCLYYYNYSTNEKVPRRATFVKSLSEGSLNYE